MSKPPRPLLPLLLFAALAQAQPAFDAVLCTSSAGDPLKPVGATDRFTTESLQLCMVLTPKEAIGAGHSLRATVVRDGAEGALGATPAYPLGEGANAFSFTIPIAGRAWARPGGAYRLRIFWDDGPDPVVELPFTIRAPRRWALLVGISDYPPKGLHPGDGDLPASAKDAERMRDLLVGDFGFAAGDVTLVQDLDATAARLRTELGKLAERAGPDDAVLFYYCGHGTQIPDLDGDEADGWDEALHTADVRPELITTAEQLRLVLSDDEIAALLAKFKTKNVTVIFDSCHSGTAVRAGEETERVDAEGFYLGMNREQSIARKLVEQAHNASRTNPTGVAAGLDLDQRYVFLAAARSWETGMTDPNGCFFSRELRSALSAADGATWGDLLRVVRPRVQRWNVGQAPNGMGALRRYPFSTVEAPADAPYERPTLAVVGGFEAAHPGTLLRSAAKGKTALVSGQHTLVAESSGVLCDVIRNGLFPVRGGQVRLTGAIAGFQARPGVVFPYAEAEVLDGSANRGDRLVPRTLRVPDPVPSVGFTFFRNTTPQDQEAMKGTLQTLVGTLNAARAMRVLFGVRADQLDYLVVPSLKEGKVVATVFTPRSLPLGSVEGDAAALARGITRIVTARHAAFARFNRVSNPSPAFPLRVVAAGGDVRRRPGQSIQCKGYVGRPAHLYVFAAATGGAPKLIASTSQPLPANQAFEFSFTTGTAARGTLMLRVIASEKPLQLDGVHDADGLIAALRAAYPAGNDPKFLSTDGWSDEVLWIDFGS